MNINVFYGILIPFLGTSVGAACVIFMKKNLNAHVQRALTGFASGVMVAASVWSLLLPSIEQSGKLGKFSFVPAVAGFWAGVLFLLLLDHVIPHIHQYSDSAEGPKSKFQKTTMMVLAVTLHNIPEGMAVDMESCAIAQVCYMCGVPFLSYRIISDTPGVKDHYKQYLNFWEEAPKRSFEMIKVLIKVLSEE